MIVLASQIIMQSVKEEVYPKKAQKGQITPINSKVLQLTPKNYNNKIIAAQMDPVEALPKEPPKEIFIAPGLPPIA
jgi:hypothetical protein